MTSLISTKKKPSLLKKRLSDGKTQAIFESCFQCPDFSSFVFLLFMKEFHEFPLSAWFRGGVWFNYSDLQGQIPAGFGRIPFRADNL